MSSMIGFRERAMAVAIFVGLFAGGLAVFPIAGPAAAQAQDGIVATDAPDDVVVSVPTESGDAAEHTPAPVPEALGGPVDLTEVRVYGASPTEFWVGFSVRDFSRPDTRVVASLSYSVCFTFSATGDVYRLVVDMAYPTTAAAGTTVTPRLDTYFFDRMGPTCDPYAGIGPDSHVSRMATQNVQPIFDVEAGTFDARIPRLAIERLTIDSTSGPVPSKGDTFSELKGYALGSQGKNEYLFDEAIGQGALTFTSDTGNDMVRLTAPNSVNVAFGLNSFGVPVYGVEVGTFQTVPLIIENRLDVAFNASFAIEMVEGDPNKWSAQLIPGLQVDAKTDEAFGSETVTVVVKAAETTRHKEKVRLLITATDPDKPGVLGATFLDVVAVEPPTSTEKTVYFHGTGNTCNTQERWLNTLKDDPLPGLSDRMELRTCEQGPGGVVSIGGGTTTFRPDIPFARDYWLSTNEPVVGAIGLSSIVRGPGTDVETEVQAVVDVTVQLLAGPVLIGETTIEDQTIPGVVPFDFEINDIVFGSGEREMRADRALGVRLIVASQDRTYEVCNSQCPPGSEREVLVPGPTGRIFVDFPTSELSVPVVRSERAGDIINITESGALMALRQADLDAERQRFTNPGNAVVFNMTVRNEGVNRDTANLAVQLNQTGWAAEILPTNRFTLDVGDAQSFAVRVVAPNEAFEGMTVGVKIIATSNVDPEAQAVVPLSVKVTTGTILESEEVDPSIGTAALEEDTPLGLWVPMVVFIGLAMIGRRRRRC